MDEKGHKTTQIHTFSGNHFKSQIIINRCMNLCQIWDFFYTKLVSSIITTTQSVLTNTFMQFKCQAFVSCFGKSAFFIEERQDTERLLKMNCNFYLHLLSKSNRKNNTIWLSVHFIIAHYIPGSVTRGHDIQQSGNIPKSYICIYS